MAIGEQFPQTFILPGRPAWNRVSRLHASILGRRSRDKTLQRKLKAAPTAKLNMDAASRHKVAAACMVQTATKRRMEATLPAHFAFRLERMMRLCLMAAQTTSAANRKRQTLPESSTRPTRFRADVRLLNGTSKHRHPINKDINAGSPSAKISGNLPFGTSRHAT